MDALEQLEADFDGQSLTTGPHAMALLRPHLRENIWRAIDLPNPKTASAYDSRATYLTQAARHGQGASYS